MITQIKYTGPTQHTRIITVDQAKAASFILDEDLTWSLDNRHTVLIETELNETAREFFEADPDFEIKDVSNKDGKEAAAEIERAKQAEADAEAAAAAAAAEPEGSAGIADAPAKSRTTTSTTTASQ